MIGSKHQMRLRYGGILKLVNQWKKVSQRLILGQQSTRDDLSHKSVKQHGGSLEGRLCHSYFPTKQRESQSVRKTEMEWDRQKEINTFFYMFASSFSQPIVWNRAPGKHDSRRKDVWDCFCSELLDVTYYVTLHVFVKIYFCWCFSLFWT